METVEIKISQVKEITAGDGKKFKAYKAVQKNGNLIDCKFKNDVTNKPQEPCIIVVPEDQANVDTRKQYPVLWVGEIIECKPFAPKATNIHDFF